MPAPTDLELLHGVNVAPDLGRWLRAGPVEALLLDGDLRYVRCAGTELARRVQVAVRSRTWDTVAGERSGLVVDQRDDGFDVSYESTHRDGNLSFRWRCTIRGEPDGTISYELDGVAERDFPYRRIGLCVLHPTEVFAGCRYESSSPDGTHAGALPASVGPQVFDGTTFPPLFPAFDRLRISSRGGPAVQFIFEGDVFEMEDQRNWTDASFKSYSQNPVARVEAWELRAGTQIRQRVTIAPAAEDASTKRAITARCERAGEGAPWRAVSITCGAELAGAVPKLGVTLAADIDLPERQLGLLRELRLSHLRVDVHVAAPSWRADLARGVAVARALGCDLELAVFVNGGTEGLRELAAALSGDVALARVLLYDETTEVTPADLLAEAHSVLGPVLGATALGGGTDVYFAELNREPHLPGSFGVVAYPVTPQVHSGDDASLVETPLAQSDTVARARELAPHAAIAVTPITLKPRFNPDALDATTPPGRLPDNVDPRQVSMIAAAWMLASVHRLGEAGAASATYFETAGWRGIIEADPLPARAVRFPSLPGVLFPAYHALAEVAPHAGRPLLRCVSSDPIAADALAIAAPGEVLLVTANLSGARTIVALRGVGARAEARRLDAAAMRRQMLASDGLPGRWSACDGCSPGGELRLVLEPFEIVVIRWRP
jgi:hypothetical protein